MSPRTVRNFTSPTRHLAIAALALGALMTLTTTLITLLFVVALLHTSTTAAPRLIYSPSTHHPSLPMHWVNRFRPKCAGV